MANPDPDAWWLKPNEAFAAAYSFLNEPAEPLPLFTIRDDTAPA
ncbi:hypothetical protein [Streptomyces sp. NPDC001594]